MRIERLTSRHASAYREMMLEAYCLHPDAFTSTEAERAAQPMDWWNQRLGEAGDSDSENSKYRLELVLGAFREDELLGVAGISFNNRQKIVHKATLFGMYTPASSRGAGIGSALVGAVLQEARERQGVNLVQLTVSEGNTTAQNLYRKHGFRQYGIEPRAVAVGKGYIDKIHMWCDLK